MAERIGRGEYELGADRTKLKSDLKAAALDVLRGGQEAEGKATGIVDRTLGKLRSMSATQVGAITGAAAGAAAIAALRIGDVYDEAMDTIRAGTGATGEALAGLEQSFRNVGGRVREDLTVTAAVLADLNTRTGLTGEALETMTQRVLEFSRVTKTDATANVALLTRLFGDWSVATEDQAGLMDRLLRISQATGLEVDSLMQTVVQFGAPLRLLGFEIDEAAALLGKWEREGVNVEKMMVGLNFSVKKLAQEGVPASEMADELRRRIEAIGQSTDPVAEAIELFGLRAGPDLAAAILEGRFAVDDLVEAVRNGGDTVEGLAAEMDDAGDVVARFKNQVKLAIGPLVKDFAGLADEMGNAIFLLPALFSGLGALAGKLIALVAAQAAASGGWIAFGASALGVLGPLALVAAAVAGIIIAWDDFNKKVTEATQRTDEAAAAFLATMPSREQVEARLEALRAIPGELDGVKSALFSLDVGGVQTTWQRQIDLLEEYLRTAGANTGMSFNDGVRAGLVYGPPTPEEFLTFGPSLEELGYYGGRAVGEAAGEGMGDGFRDVRAVRMASELKKAELELRAEALRIGEAVPGELGRGMQATANQVLDGIDVLRQILETGLSPKQRAMELIGADYIKLVRQGIRSEKDGAVETAQEVAVAAIAAIEAAGLEGKKGQRGLKAIGKYYDLLLASGLTEEQARVALAAGGVSNAAISALEGRERAKTKGAETAGGYSEGIAGKAGSGRASSRLMLKHKGGSFGGRLTATGAADTVRGAAADVLSDTSGFKGYGSATIEEYRKGLASKYQAVWNTVQSIARIARVLLRASSPPDNPEIRDIGRWGEATIEEWARGLGKPLPGVRALMAEYVEAVGRLQTELPALGRVPLTAAPVLAEAHGIAIARERFAERGAGDVTEIHRHYHIGTLVADDAGLRWLGSEMRRVDSHWDRG